MIECNINGITKYFGADLIFEDISFDIKTNERIGLIGPNGSGKTTIMKIIKGEEHISTGSVTFRKGINVGYLDQIPEYEDYVVVSDILESAFTKVYEIKKQIDDCTMSFKNLTDDKLERAMNKYSSLIHEFELLDGYLIETNINKVATGLKISDTLRDMQFNKLSGGEKTRVMLGKILLENPSLLMLDEPSNHLDLESIEWLENYLKDYSGAVLIISHDRYFLDKVCKKIVELSTYKAHVYYGNYSYYVIEKERRFLLELKVYLAQERKINRMETQIERYRIWGRMRDSDKMFKRAKELEKRLEKIEKLDKPIKDNPKMKINSGSVNRSGKIVLEADDINKSFGDVTLLLNAHINMIYQDRLAILGANGSGKTTLIKMLLEDCDKQEPIYKWGSKLNLGYLPQEVIFENDSLSVLEYFMNEHQVGQNEARSELAKALFIRDDVFKKIKHLSGGEKSKLKLCSLTFNKVNFMILDEPTNHLDIDSREILEELLLEFDGTILFVSHDRYFIKKLANRIAEIDNQELHYYECEYDYYRFLKSKENTVEAPISKKSKRRVRNTQSSINHKEDISLLIQEIELKIEEIDIEMKEASYDAIKLQELFEVKEELELELIDLYEEYEEK
jgi:ATP-binding cassette subfamily F protein 3